MQERQLCAQQGIIAEEKMEQFSGHVPLSLDIAPQIVNATVRIYQSYFDKESEADELDNNGLRDWIEALCEQLSQSNAKSKTALRDLRPNLGLHHRGSNLTLPLEHVRFTVYLDGCEHWPVCMCLTRLEHHGADEHVS